MQKISWTQAKRENKKKYFTGAPCKRGHLCERYTSTGTCIQCIRLCNDNQRKENPLGHHLAVKKLNLKKKYNLTLEQYEKLMRLQNSKCAVCLCLLKDIKICVDHDHVTGKVRGLLCHNCNVAIGHLKENIGTLKQAIVYLEHG